MTLHSRRSFTTSDTGRAASSYSKRLIEASPSLKL